MFNLCSHCFHTKDNVKLIRKDIENELFSYLGGILKNYKSNSIQIGGTPHIPNQKKQTHEKKVFKMKYHLRIEYKKVSREIKPFRSIWIPYEERYL